MVVGIASVLTGSTFGLWTMVSSNMLRRMPIFYRPWEHAIAVCFFGYLGYRAGTLREFMEERVMLMAKERIVADKDKLNEKYRLILGDEKYAKWFPEEQSA